MDFAFEQFEQFFSIVWFDPWAHNFHNFDSLDYLLWHRMYVTLSNQQLHLYCEPKAGAECTSWLLSLAFPPLPEVPHCYPKAVQNCKALNRRRILMSLGSLVMQIWCNTCAVAPQGSSQGTFLWKEPEKGTGSQLLRGQSCFFHHQDGSALAFRPLNSI